MSSLTIIVAMDAAGGIGIDNTLPWKLPEDLAHFKRATTGHPILMGRKTFESIGRPLPNRRNIVITRNAGWRHDGVETAGSIEDAIALLDGADGFVIGGAEIYRQSLAQPSVRCLMITEIAHTFPCDAFFPAIDHGAWRETARERHVSQDALPYAFVTLRRQARQP